MLHLIFYKSDSSAQNFMTGKSLKYLKTYTPLCLRATFINAMSDQDLEARQIMFINMHRLHMNKNVLLVHVYRMSAFLLFHVKKFKCTLKKKVMLHVICPVSTKMSSEILAKSVFNHYVFNFNKLLYCWRITLIGEVMFRLDPQCCLLMGH